VPENRKDRAFEELEPMDAAYNELKEKFVNKKLFLKEASEKIEVAITEFSNDNTIVIAMIPGLVLPNIITIYGLSNRYIEVYLELLE
jgi:hypothetical protein